MGQGRAERGLACVKVASVCKINLRSTASAFTRLKSGVSYALCLVLYSFEPQLKLYKRV